MMKWSAYRWRDIRNCVGFAAACLRLVRYRYRGKHRSTLTLVIETAESFAGGAVIERDVFEDVLDAAEIALDAAAGVEVRRGYYKQPRGVGTVSYTIALAAVDTARAVRLAAGGNGDNGSASAAQDVAYNTATANRDRVIWGKINRLRAQWIVRDQLPEATDAQKHAGLALLLGGGEPGAVQDL